MMTIRENVGMMPGGIIYEDPRTPAAKWLDDHTWTDERARQIVAFRLANPTIYPEPEWTDVKFVAQQVVDFNCQRIGYNPQFCMEYNKPAPYVAPAARTCPEDGAKLDEKYCPTCSGKKLIGYECPVCKKEYPK